MDKETRNTIERATQQIRALLEEDFASQLEGTFDVLRSGSIAAKAGPHLSPRQVFQRNKIVAAIEHKRAAGMTSADAIADYLRDAAFTTLNRFVALKMLEARELVQECISKGELSAGFLEFCGMAPGVALLSGSAGYRLYIESLFDELSTEVKVLFDRRDEASVLWPKLATFEALLDVLNSAELVNVWAEDETIGWVYQFFNGNDERRAMREASQAPRNSRELAIRNQFFTPRYVVQFLTDNTLGRLWYDMRKGKTGLKRTCSFFMQTCDGISSGNGMVIPKDPRDISVIDPACGSGHFLIYAFDLLQEIYLESWGDEGGPPSVETGHSLREDYPDQQEFFRALPGLVLRQNLFGVDIDARAAQIAALALWMRAQRAFKEFAVKGSNRPLVARTNIVVAEAMPGEALLRDEFLGTLDKSLASLVQRVFKKMNLAGDAGPLIRIELEIDEAIREIYGETGPLFHESDRSTWLRAEAQLHEALREYVLRANNGSKQRRRLFAEDAESGLAFIDVCRRRYDVALMNPPFGEFIDKQFDFLDEQYKRSKRDLAIAFIDRGLELAPMVGGLHSRKPFFLDTQSAWRDALRGGHFFASTADLGHRVLDNALVEVAASVIRTGHGPSVFIQCLDASDKEAALREVVREGTQHPRVAIWNLSEFSDLPAGQFAYAVPRNLLELYSRCARLDPAIALCRDGLSTRDNFRFLRLHWELPELRPDGPWVRVAKGGEYQPFYLDCELVAYWQGGVGEMFAYGEALGNGAVTRKGSSHYFKPALTYTERTASRLSVRVLPSDTAFTTAGPGIVLVEADDALATLGVLNSFIFAALHEVCIGGGDSVSSGSAARHYTPGGLGQMPFPSREKLREHKWPTAALIDNWLALARRAETSPLFSPPVSITAQTIAELADELLREEEGHFLAIWNQSRSLEECALSAYGLDSKTLPSLRSVVGPHPAYYPEGDSLQADDAFARYFALDEDSLVDQVAADLGNPRWAVVKSYVANRRYELISHRWAVHPSAVVHERRHRKLLPPQYASGVAKQVIGVVIGRAFGRWGAEQQPSPSAMELFSVGTPARPPTDPLHSFLPEDEGHPNDLVTLVERVAETRVPRGILDDAVRLLRGKSATLREYVRSEFFSQHLKDTTLHRRSAPVLWQLATPSCRYSVWLSYHHTTKDTLYKIVSDLVTPKLQLEERRYANMLSDVAPSGPRGRKEAGEQAAFIDELRAMRDELSKLAPLWAPDFRDGVVINFAPLWRLIPQHKAWQKELRTTWASLCAGTYDWSQLAMRLWPERVVPKCRTDRSFAIAHGLLDVFWTEGVDGKWRQADDPTISVEDVVRQHSRSSVKAALTSVLAESSITKRAAGNGPRRGASRARIGSP